MSGTSQVNGGQFPIVSIRYRGQVKQFLLPRSTAQLRSVVAAEFGLSEAAWLTLSAHLPAPESAAAAAPAPEVYVPFEVEYLSSSVTYDLKNHSSTHAGHSASAQHAPAYHTASSNSSSAYAVDPSRVYSGASHSVAVTPSTDVPLGHNEVLALYDYTAKTTAEISFSAGDVLVVTGKYSDGWYKGEVVRKSAASGARSGAEAESKQLVDFSLPPAKVGYFPANYVHGIEQVRLNFQQAAEIGEDPLQDREYFDSYSSLYIHHQMLQDAPRTLGYKAAVQALQPFIKDRVVMDVGCGTSVLSCFCALVGAKAVLGVDASDIIKVAADMVVRENHLQDRVLLLKGKVEDLELPPALPTDDKKVDVIISEWMGTFLVCESMIESVLVARDRFLRPGGVLMPSSATLFLAPLQAEEYFNSHVRFWDDVYGLKMTCLKPEAKRTFFAKPIYDQVAKPEQVMAKPANVWHLDLYTADSKTLETTTSPFEFVMNRTGDMHGFISWFDVDFAANGCETVVLSTSPEAKPTHWKQVLFFLPTPIQVQSGQKMTGSLMIRRNKYWRRHYEGEIVFSFDPADPVDTPMESGAPALLSDVVSSRAPPPAPQQFKYQFELWR